MGRYRGKVSLELSIGELISLRRFLNRGIACAHGRCPDYGLPTWETADRLLPKIQQAYLEAKKRRARMGRP